MDAEAQEADAFSENDLRLFSTFAAWAAVALNNADVHGRLERKKLQLDRHVGEIDRMNKELRDYASRIEETNISLEKRIKELETLHEASRAITSSLDLKETLDAIVSMTREIIDSSSCAINLLDEERSFDGSSVLTRVMSSPEDRQVSADDAEQSQNKKVHLAVPLTIGNRVIGHFELSSMDESDFSDSAKRVLQVLASQAAIAIENARLFESTQQTYFETIRSLAQALEARDSYTKGHSERVTLYALKMSEFMHLSAHSHRVLNYAGMLHDIGKIGISDSILHKRLRLSDDEWATIRNHPLFGDSIIGPIKFLSDAQKVVLRHHERFDGKGYPGQLKGEEIPLEARIIAVADAYDAMTSNRPYRDAMKHELAIEEIRRSSGKQFDPSIVDAFLAIVDEVRAKITN